MPVAGKPPKKGKRTGQEDRQELSSVPRSPPFVVACLVGDLHISQRPPLARSVEPDWLDVQKGYMVQLDRIAGKHQCPILCAGDLFDTWQQPPEVVNLCLEYLPFMYGVPGQHDMWHHNYGDVRKTSFWTLVKAKKFALLEPGKPIEIGVGTPLRLHGWPFGFPIRPPGKVYTLCLEVAIVHDYVWCKGTGYQGAPEEKRVKNRKRNLLGYDVVVSGDNHQAFTIQGDGKKSPTIYNCGGFQRRKQDERSYRPSVGILYSNGTVKREYLDTSKDRFLEPDKLLELFNSDRYQEIVDELNVLGDGAIDFAEAIRHRLGKEDVRPLSKDMTLEAMEK